MAMLISRASGNFTSSSTWGVADSATGSQLINFSASTNTTTSYVYSNTFTGTNTRVADGIVLFLKRLNTTGTVTVALSDDNGVTATRSVTVNASDLPADESWVFFKFGTTLTLDGGTDYRVGVVASSADNALIYRDSTAGNWGRIVSTTTTGAPAATDTMLIVGEWTGAGASSSYTVTMDNTNSAVDFGTNTSNGPPLQTIPRLFNGIQIGQNGTLTWGTSAATNYYLKVSGDVVVRSGGTYNMGTSGTPCPRDSTMTLLLDSTSNSTTTSFGFVALNGSTVSVYGQSRTSGKNIVQCKLSADAAVSATSLTIDTDTGWLDNDEIVIASTTRTATECELGALNGAAGASTLTVDGFAGTAGGLAFAHSGTSPTQAEIINLTRNVVIRGNSTTQEAYVSAANVASFNIQWCRFLFASSTSGVSTTFTSSVNPINISYCSFSNGVGNISFTCLGTIANCVFHEPNLSFANVVSLSANAITCTDCTIIRATNTGFAMFGISGSVFERNTAAGCSTGFSMVPQNASITVSDLVVHSSSGSGISFSNSTSLPTVSFRGTNIKSWRNSVSGITTTVTTRIEITDGLFFGNQNQNINCSVDAFFVTLNNCTLAGDTSFSTPNGINIGGTRSGVININNSSFSPTSGIYVPNTTADINISNNARPMITLNNTILGAATEVLNPDQLSTSGFIKSSKHEQTEGAFKSWFQSGIIERDTTIFNTAAPSERLTPTSATIKLASGPRLVAVDDGGTITINAYVRKSTAGDGAAYNGNQPRLIVRANPAAGITTDTVLDTMTVGTGTWEQLTGTTAAVDADGALEFYVDCDGTTGWINVDDWSVT